MGSERKGGKEWKGCEGRGEGCVIRREAGREKKGEEVLGESRTPSYEPCHKMLASTGGHVPSVPWVRSNTVAHHSHEPLYGTNKFIHNIYLVVR